MTIAATRRMTTAELLALPKDGRRRWLINGELRENPMTTRNRFHSICMARVTGILFNWLEGRPAPRGEIVCGEAGVRLPGGDDGDTTVGVDVAFVPPEVLVRQTDETTLIEGVPTLVVEILSPSNTVEEIKEKIAAYTAAGVPLVWLVDTDDRTVMIYRLGDEPTLVNAKQELAGGDVLPGFRVPVARLFA